MTAQPDDRAAEWKRASGIWHSWSEIHWKESGTNPFARPAKPGAEERVGEESRSRTEERPDRV